MDDEYYKRSYRAPPGARQHLQKEKEQQQVEHMNELYELVIRKKKGNKEPLLGDNEIGPESKEIKINIEQLKGYHERGNTAEWNEIPQNFIIPEKPKKKTGCTKYCYVEHYTKYFEVTTKEVLVRIVKSLFPITRGSIYSEDTLRPDMYGPLWTMICLFVMIPIFGNINQYLKAYQQGELDKYIPDLSNIWALMSCLLIYFLLVPYILHTIFRFGSGFGAVDSRYFFIASIYGYSFTPFTIGVFFHTIPYPTAEWVSLLLPAVSSIVFLTKELLGFASAALNSKCLKLVAIMMGLGHIAFIAMLKWQFL
ncbi:unnamed protein product [Moneuplotes crassus]|uniref:Protein YIPF n=1 Tax=Euplotes crassus TaxID=5936 RepID=A0AAD1XMG1_EUPCR|nr:unnamed protein product [Moneuplotes crassus]